MPRGRRLRRVGSEPEVTVFKPRGVPASALKSTELKVEELEAMRLAYVEELSQNEAADAMNISQPTFSRLVDDANSKVARALVEGNAIIIKGGDYMVEKGVPKRDGSGRGTRANKGRGGCNPAQDKNARPGFGGGRGRGRRFQ
ncbi:MAG: DUF134 domain-containing protein [Candidatus Micrarchaeota archaeon]